VSPRLDPRELALAALFAALISMGALISIPMVGPVPLTLQVFFVLLAGLVLGAQLAALSVTAYLVIGLVAPVYAQGASGLGALVGPAGGYLLGFVVGAWLVGWLMERLRPRTLPVLSLTASAGLVPIYALGALWLSLQLHVPTLHSVLWLGVAQFVPIDLVKVIATAGAARALISLPLGLPALAPPR